MVIKLPRGVARRAFKRGQKASSESTLLPQAAAVQVAALQANYHASFGAGTMPKFSGDESMSGATVEDFESTVSRRFASTAPRCAAQATVQRGRFSGSASSGLGSSGGA